MKILGLSIVFLFVFLKSSSGELNLENVFDEIMKSDDIDECIGQFKNLSSLLRSKMIDASAKLLPSGVLDGNLVNLGSFDECLSITAKSEDIYGKYCLATIDVEKLIKAEQSWVMNDTLTLIHQAGENLGKIPSMDNIDILSKLFKFGICLPDKCSSKFIKKHLHLDITDAECYTTLTNSELDTKAIITIGILLVVLAIAIIATIYDVYVRCRRTRPIHPIFIAFSLYTNTLKLVKSSSSTERLTCLDGIKVLSMMWVILGHTYLLMPLIATVDNLVYIGTDWINDTENMFILSATLAVDTFYTIGGLLTVYVFMKSPVLEAKESLKNIPWLYLHRYLRLTPAFAIMILIYGTGLIKYTTNGPKWYLMNETIDNCANNWWAALLYIQNYFGYQNFCMVQSWYLATDFQIFIVAPFILIPLRKWPKYTIRFLYVLAFAGLIGPFCMGYIDKINGIGEGLVSKIYSNNYYFMTYTRFSPYVIGMIVGYNVYKLKAKRDQFVLNMPECLFFWILALGGLVFCIFDGHEVSKHSKDALIDGLYMGFNRAIWSISIALSILLCATGNGKIINTLLSLPIFQVIAKLSYSMYLVHYVVILSVYASSRTPFHVNNFFALSQFTSNFVLTLCISVYLCLLFESPMITIERILFPQL
ncbi:hypothetical protein HHI36_021868 [Cryptolaemus montrouzieri]|uniref:Nose resistant-to-fluoxetine protein N-terminal domain-containing protein n=1 Tax=Cryptolaemus montrouzieri TaxID=559131 RepID=A0ABD2MZE9_9CUCU